MNSLDIKTEWEQYCTKTLQEATPILKDLGYTLEDVQPHLGGERYLMQAVTTTSGRKLILLGNNSNGRVVIKVTNDPGGIAELEHERACRQFLTEINFAYDVFFSPEELLFVKKQGYIISVLKYIEQDCAFLDRPIEKQFSYALCAFKAQESAHATTWKHRARINKVFNMRDAQSYIDTFASFIENIAEHSSSTEILKRTYNELHESHQTIEQYCDFLTHTDFVPHNIRIRDKRIYLLDHSSLCFGNKHEGWARFINFMSLYNPPLEEALLQYVHDNRAPEEMNSLRLIRMYRLGEIIWYYTQAVERSSGDLKALNEARVTFWTSLLEAVMQNTQLDTEIIESYKKTRDGLRSDTERLRQVDLH